MSDQIELRQLGWCIVELMGHRRLAGEVSEEALFGTVLLRIDVPGGEQGATEATQYYGGGAIYAITPTTEELARKVASYSRPAPVTRCALPEAAPTGASDFESDLLGDDQEQDAEY